MFDLPADVSRVDFFVMVWVLNPTRFFVEAEVDFEPRDDGVVLRPALVLVPVRDDPVVDFVPFFTRSPLLQENQKFL